MLAIPLPRSTILSGISKRRIGSFVSRFIIQIDGRCTCVALSEWRRCHETNRKFYFCSNVKWNCIFTWIFQKACVHEPQSIAFIDHSAVNGNDTLWIGAQIWLRDEYTTIFLVQWWWKQFKGNWDSFTCNSFVAKSGYARKLGLDPRVDFVRM